MEDSRSLKRYRPKSSDNKEDKKHDRSHKRHKHKKSKKKYRKREHRYSSSSDEPEDKVTLKMRSKHKRKCKKRREHTEYYEKIKTKSVIEIKQTEVEEPLIGPEVPAELLQKAQSMAPMSKEEWEKRQNTVRRVFDETTSRTRLVRGEGEIIEEIVSRERHMEINRQATLGDGNFFQSNVRKKI